MTINSETQKAKNKVKRYDEYIKSRPEQLDLFSLSNIFPSKRDKYSNTVELYDTIPKYFHGDVEKIRTQDGLLKSLVREFVHRKQKMTLRISPAQIETKNGEKAFFPSQREEIIEDVLKKFAINPNRNEFLDDRLSIRFTLYELWKELRKVRHTFSHEEIRESLEILSKTNLEIKSSGDEITFSSNMFETFGKVDINDNKNSEDLEERSKKITYFIRFNSLVSGSIKDKSWRIINYDQCMAYRKVISRWLHKRISHMFLVGDIDITYNIMLSTIVRDSGMTEYGKISNNIVQVEDCLKEMITVGSIDKYEVSKIYFKERKNKIEDAKFTIHVSSSFFEEAKLNHLIFKDQNEIKQIQDNGKKKSDHKTLQKNNQNKQTQDNSNGVNTIEEFISSYTDEVPRAIYRKILEHSGESIFSTWIVRLKYMGIKEGVLTFLAQTEFIQSYITQKFFNGTKRVIDGKIVWVRKGIKQLCEEVCPDIKGVVIEAPPRAIREYHWDSI